jgi:hypothetical protein
MVAIVPASGQMSQNDAESCCDVMFTIIIRSVECGHAKEKVFSNKRKNHAHCTTNKFSIVIGHYFNRAHSATGAAITTFLD